MTRIGNYDLLFDALEQACAHPDTYDQSTWRRPSPCGTTRCIAGWIAHLDGWVDLAGTRDEFYWSSRVVRDGVVAHIGDAALVSLRLDPEVFGEPEIIVDRDRRGGRSLERWGAVEGSDQYQAVEDLVDELFSGTLPFDVILENVVAYATEDGLDLDALDWSRWPTLREPLMAARRNFVPQEVDN